MLDLSFCRDKIKGFQSMEDIANAMAASREAYNAIYRPVALEHSGDKQPGKAERLLLGTDEAQG